MRAESLDHLVLTVADIEASAAWYTQVLGMTHVTFAGGRHALQFGHQKINLHQVGDTIEPRARAPLAGSADLCFVVSGRAEAVLVHLEEFGVPVELGPVQREGARGEMTSVYVRDPDENLVELSVYHRLHGAAALRT